MFYIISKKNMAIHQEPTRPSWKSNSYKSAAAAKAGITRTIKFYQKAIADVQSVVAEGKSEFHSPYYNHYRDATDPVLGRTHKADIDNFVVMSEDEYETVEPMITRTGICPGTGKEMTYTSSINEPHYLSPLSESYWSA